MTDKRAPKATVAHLINSLAVLRCESIHDNEFNQLLSGLQNTLGVMYGDVAALYFSGYDDDCWNVLDYDTKIGILKDYVQTELNFETGQEDHREKYEKLLDAKAEEV